MILNALEFKREGKQGRLAVEEGSVQMTLLY